MAQDITGLVLQPQEEDPEDQPIAQKVRDWWIEAFNMAVDAEIEDLTGG